MATRSLRKYKFDPDYIVEPRETLLEIDGDANLLDGNPVIDKTLARQLMLETGASMALWLNLDKHYRQQLLKVKGLS